jgi:hypothetical protein
MASGIDVSQLGTFNPIELADIRQVVAERFFSAPEFSRLFSVYDGYDKKTQLVLADELGLSGILDSSNTRPESGGMGITLADKFIDTVLIGDTKKHTQASFDKDFKMVVRKSAKDYNELSETDQIAIYITEKMITYMEEARWRLAMLGDTTADINTNGGALVNTYTIGGVTYNNNKKMWNPLNGVWAQLKAGVVATKTPRATIAENYATSKTSQLAITDAHCFDAIKAVYDNAPDDLKAMPNAYILATSKVYNGYKNYLLSGSLSGGGLTQLVVDGIPTPAYNGVPILLDGKTGNSILKYTNVNPSTKINGATTATTYTEIVVLSTAGYPETGTISIGTGGTGSVFVYTSKTATKFVGASQLMGVNADESAVTLLNPLYDMPHRVLMTTPENMGFYTLDQNDFASLESFYDKVSRTTYMGYDFLMDVVIGREELCSVAY